MPVRLLASLAASLCIAHTAQAYIVGGPIVPAYAEAYFGIIQEGEVVFTQCTISYCPQPPDPVCLQQWFNVKIRLVAVLAPNDLVILRTINGSEFVEHRMGQAGTTEMEVIQRDSCVEVWLHGVSISVAVPFALHVQLS